MGTGAITMPKRGDPAHVPAGATMPLALAGFNAFGENDMELGNAMELGKAVADRPERELERILTTVTRHHNHAINSLGRLGDLRNRLLGEGESEPGNDEKIPQPVRSELPELHARLERLGETLEQIEHNIGRLETI